MYTITVKKEFSAAHRLRDYHGSCEELHGHNWRVGASLSGQELDATGMVMDFSVLKKILVEILEKLDHKFINEVDPFTKINPTSENIAKWIYGQLKEKCNNTKANVKSITVWETDTSSAIYEE